MVCLQLNKLSNAMFGANFRITYHSNNFSLISVKGTGYMEIYEVHENTEIQVCASEQHLHLC